MIEHEGISDSAAGALAGVPSSTLARWKLEHEAFALELERAQALFGLAQVRAIRTARRRDGSPDCRAAVWYGPLSRRRRVAGAGAHAEQGATGDRHAGAGRAQAGTPPVESENCAILPETRTAHSGRECVRDAPVGFPRTGPAAQNDTIRPETRSGDREPGEGAPAPPRRRCKRYNSSRNSVRRRRTR
jgi:hypothetical protein